MLIDDDPDMAPGWIAELLWENELQPASKGNIAIIFFNVDIDHFSDIAINGGIATI